MAVPVAIVSTALSVYGQIKAGNAAKKAGDANADAALEMAGIREDQQRAIDQRTMSRARSLVGASGVTLEGSPLAALAESAKQAELNALAVRRGGELTAEAERRAGKNARTSARFGAAGSLLTGGADVAEKKGWV